MNRVSGDPGDPLYTRQNALFSIDPIQTREWAHKITKGPFEPFVNQFSEAWK